ncbi:MAG TPA: hypothetical protein EYP19_14635 [Desulfobacterales bacterium]|nr:hypothetical protein [Desulfobacterales bacterium]
MKSQHKPKHRSNLQHETEMLRLQEEMREQERMAAWKKLSASTAHRVGTITSDIRGVVTRLSSQLEAQQVSHDVSERLERLETSLQKMQTIVRKFADFSRPRQFELQTVQVHHIIERAVEEIEVNLPGNVTLVYDFCDNLPPVRGDEGHLLYIFHELLNNAVLALPKCGRITVTVRKSAMLTMGVRSEAAQEIIQQELARRGLPASFAGEGRACVGSA